MPSFFECETANDAWHLAALELLDAPEKSSQASRLGPVREILHSHFHIHNPRQRWVLSRNPAINPAFAIAEVIWIMCGRNDSSFLNFWNPALPKFAGEGNLYHGAYGYRLKHNLGIDQIERAYQVLLKNPDSRQVVLQIWDSRIDMPNSNGEPLTADVPCNICSMLNIRNGRLEWTQIMRSNDLFLGLPHNFVQFTSLQEILAGWLKVDVGSYTQISNSLHCYEHDLGKYSISDVENITNTDDLALPKEQADEALFIIEKTMDRLRAPDLEIKDFSNLLLEGENMPEGYRNMLLIVAADAARRREWDGQAVTAISKCTNACLVDAWTLWKNRNSAKKK